MDLTFFEMKLKFYAFLKVRAGCLRSPLFYGDGFGEISRLIHVGTFQNRNVVGE